LSSADKGEGVLQMQTSVLFDVEHIEIFGVSARTEKRGLSQCGHFSEE